MSRRPVNSRTDGEGDSGKSRNERVCGDCLKSLGRQSNGTENCGGRGSVGLGRSR